MKTSALKFLDNSSDLKDREHLTGTFTKQISLKPLLN